MLFHPIEISKTASSGAWSFNTDKISMGIIRQIVIKAATDTTTFDFYLLDDKSNYVYDTRTRGMTPTGTLNELLQLPVRGIYTVGVVSSFVLDEEFTGRIMVQED